MGPTPNVYLFSPKDDPQLVPYLAALHAQCINHDHTIATFLPPLSHEKLLAWWKERLAEVNAGTRLIFILLNEETPQAKFKGTELVGVVMLSMPQSETGSMRGIVEKLLINPKYRRRGGARQLIGALEAEALQRGKTVLMLDTETGSVAEEVYRKFGYIELGKVPNYSISPGGGQKTETFFYKHLV